MPSTKTVTRLYASFEHRLFTNSCSLGRVATLAGLKLLALAKESGCSYAACTGTSLAKLIDATPSGIGYAIDKLVHRGYFTVTQGSGYTRIFTPVLQPPARVNGHHAANNHARPRL